MLSRLQVKRISKYKILGYGKTRARRILSVLDSLEEAGRLDFDNARKFEITYGEWLASCHFYTTKVSEQLPYLREYLLIDDQGTLNFS